jgi:hypothetical protein
MITKKYPSIAGFAAWRVGAEDPAIWPIVRELTMQSPSIRPAPESFLIEGPRELQVVAGETASGIYSYIAINGFSATVNASANLVDAFSGTAAFSSPTLGRNAGVRLFVSVPKSTPAGTYRVKVLMTGAGITQDKVVNVKVTAPPAPGRRRAVR